MLLSGEARPLLGGGGQVPVLRFGGDRAGRSCTDRPGSCGDSGAGPGLQRRPVSPCLGTPHWEAAGEPWGRGRRPQGRRYRGNGQPAVG